MSENRERSRRLRAAHQIRYTVRFGAFRLNGVGWTGVPVTERMRHN